MRRASRYRAFGALARVDAKDVVRDPQIGVSALVMAAVILVLHTCMWLAFTVAGDEPQVRLDGISAAVAGDAFGRSAEAGDGSRANVSIEADSANTAADGAVADEAFTIRLLEPGIAWEGVWQSLREAGAPARNISVVAQSGDAVPHFLRMNLGTALLAAVASVALLGTTVPLVAARGRGMLRLLGTTPLPPWIFLGSKIPARLVLTVLFAAGIFWIARALNYADPSALPRFVVTLFCGTVFLFGIATLCAARARNAAAVQQAMVMVTLGLLYTSGAIIPTAMMTEPYRTLMGLLPGSWLTEPANADLAGIDPALPVAVYWVLMLTAGVVCFIIAARRFSWGEERTAS